MKALVEHFWKLFAVAIACVSLFGLYGVKQKWESAIDESNATYRQRMFSRGAMELVSGKGDQKDSATVKLKDGATVERPARRGLSGIGIPLL